MRIKIFTNNSNREIDGIVLIKRLRLLLHGNLVKILPFDHTIPGNHSIKWNGMDELGKPVPSGVYFCKLEMENFMETLKLVLLN